MDSSSEDKNRTYFDDKPISPSHSSKNSKDINKNSSNPENVYER